MSLRRPNRRKLAARISQLTEELQRERIESANRLAVIESRLAALEDEQLELSEARSRHRDELAQIGRALAAHHAALERTVAGLAGPNEGGSDPKPVGIPPRQQDHQTHALRSHAGASG
jgi:hypothetical protein